MCIVVRALDDSGVETEFLCDTGYGGGGPSVPLPLRAGEEVCTPQGESYRLAIGCPEAWEDSWILEVRSGRTENSISSVLPTRL